ncbi:MAG: DeoR family transcriptional regulator [Candidatus Aenigmarchaeota archaeon]|nr:DeoR family transcriptional regulator [Candidatus Aenigmarchaeota archaeon]NCS70761.1 DeoR family transcriptional regulator [Candidatus Aenigmarchaeota archaeon]OIN87377.1 MAG: hypothetical protein AUJ50_02680 [Candidatus Aenigmarchaeota archaeon CG1_02_38_14]
MDAEKFLELRESEKIEFKKSLAVIKEIIETISAFANRHGGAIFVGIEENKDGTIKRIVGVNVGGKTIEKLANEIKQNTDPRIYPSIKMKDLQGKSVMIIKVNGYHIKPVFAKINKIPIAFKRVGRTNQKIDVNELREIISEGKEFLWDSQVCKEAKLEDIDKNKVRLFISRARGERGLKISKNAAMTEALTSLKLLKNKKPTNACMLLFSKKPEFLQSEVKCIRFSGNDPVKPYIDFQTLNGDVFDLVDKAEDFVLRNIKMSIWLIPDQVQREEKYEYPPDAIREAIANAVVHRDYESPSKVQVRIFNDRIEIWNPGRLPMGWTVERLKQKHESIPRNPLLFKQLFWVKYVEDVGGGTLDIIRSCKEWGLPEPEFEFTGTSLIVTFRLSKLTKDRLEALGLNERGKKVIEYLKEHRKITTKKYSEIFGVTMRMARNDLKELIEKKIVIKRGVSDKKTYYSLAEI